jgi:hypothetical protein
MALFYAGTQVSGEYSSNILLYVWSRRNPHIRMNFFGIITFNAPYLPYVLFAFSLLLGNSVVVDFMGTRALAPGDCVRRHRRRTLLLLP